MSTLEEDYAALKDHPVVVELSDSIYTEEDLYILETVKDTAFTIQSCVTIAGDHLLEIQVSESNLSTIKPFPEVVAALELNQKQL